MGLEEAQAAGIYLRLSESAALSGQGKAGLYRDPELGIALAWQESQRPNAAWAERYHPGFDAAMAFLAASQAANVAEEQAREAARQRELEQARELAEAQQLRLEQQQRAAGKLRKMIVGLAAVALIAGLACAAALVARNEASRLAEVASQEKVKAEQEKDKAQQSAAEADRQRDTAHLARQAEQKIATQAKTDREIAQRDNYRSTIKLAESMLQGDAQSKYRVADILWGAQPELRGWEWGYLMARCPLEQWSLQTNQGGLDTLAASVDGRFLATAGVDGTVALWDSWTRKELWRQKTGRVHALDIDSRGRYVGIGSGEESQPYFRILDFATGRLVHKATATGPASVAFSASGRDFYVYPARQLEAARQLERFNSDNWELLSSVVTEGQRGWNSNQKVLADVAGAYVGLHHYGSDGRVSSLYDAQTLRPTADLDPILPTEARNLSSGSRPVLHSGLGKIVYSEGPMVFDDILDWRSRKNRGSRELFDLPAIVKHLAYDPRSQTVIAASNDGTVRRLDSAGKTRTLWHGAPISGLVLLSDGRFVTGGADGLLKCWELGGATDLAANTNAGAPSASANGYLAFAGERLLYQNYVRKNVFLFELSPPSKRMFVRPEAGEFGGNFPLLRPQTNELIVDSPTGLSFYSLGREGLKSEKNKSIAIAGPHRAAFDAAGRRMVVSKDDGEVWGFDLNSDRRLPAPEARGVGAVAINPAGTRAALLTKTGLQVWRVSTGRMLQRVDYQPGAGPVMEKNLIMAAPVFHPDGKLIAFSENWDAVSSLVLWDTTRGQRRATIKGEPGIQFPVLQWCQTCCVFSPDGSRIFAPCSDAKVRIWDWRLGKELLALSDVKVASKVAASPDGVTIAYAGWAPSLRVAKALPWITRRDAHFYRAVDDFRIYTALLPGFEKSEADQAELLGDIHCRRGEAPKAQEHYAKAIKICQESVLGAPDDVELQCRLAVLDAKQFAAAEAAEVNGGTDVLGQAVKFWQQLPFASPAQQHLLHAQLRLVDRRLAQDQQDGTEFLQTVLKSWVVRAEKEPENRFVKCGLRELLARLVWASRTRGDQRAIDRLVSTHPALAVTIGDLNAGDTEWKAAIAVYSKGITEKTTNSALLGKRARAYEQLQNWEAAAADWSRATTGNPEGARCLAEFARRLAYDHKQFAAAAKLWAEAMEGDRKLADDRQTQHRYNAACAAALAAAGQGQDEPPLDDAAKAKLRRQALDWLKAERTAWGKLLESGPPQARPFIVRTLSHWQKDTDLAGIRDAAALAKLPADERAAFTQLWADVAALLKKAEEKPK